MKRVINSYSKLAKSIDVDIKCKKIRCDWKCLPSEKIVYIPRLESEQGDKAFIDNICKLLPLKYKYLAYSLPSFMWSFMHEVGHCETKEETVLFSMIRDFINFCGKHSLLTRKIINKMYFNLPAEKDATLWAIDYIINNLHDIELASNRIAKNYVNYFNRIGLEF